MPVNLHILTGHSYFKNRPPGVERYRGSVNLKLADVTNALFELIFYGLGIVHLIPRFAILTASGQRWWGCYIGGG